MTTENIALFKAIGAKMDFLNQRQRVISQNVANADTPSYKPQDIKDEDFGRVLRNVVDTQKMGVYLETTEPLHMPAPDGALTPEEGKQKTVYEVAPVGNSVIMEEQLLNSNKTIADYNLMTTLYQKNVGMIKIAIGTNA